MSSDSLESLPTRELIRLVRDLRERFAQLEAENLKLREELDELKRKQNRSAAPFSKGKPKANPKRPGRKPGQGSFRRREEPEIGPDDNVRSMEARLIAQGAVVKLSSMRKQAWNSSGDGKHGRCAGKDCPRHIDLESGSRRMQLWLLRERNSPGLAARPTRGHRSPCGSQGSVVWTGSALSLRGDSTQSSSDCSRDLRH